MHCGACRCSLAMWEGGHRLASPPRRHTARRSIARSGSGGGPTAETLTSRGVAAASQAEVQSGRAGVCVCVCVPCCDEKVRAVRDGTAPREINELIECGRVYLSGAEVHSQA